MDKTNMGWSEPRLLVSPHNPEVVVSDVQEANSGNLYFYGSHENLPGERGIIRARLESGVLYDVKPLDPTINSDYVDSCPAIDPDERFIVFVSNRPDGHSQQDLYISFRQMDDTWGPALNLGEKINTVGDYHDWPCFSPDGKYLFFTSWLDPYRNMDISSTNFQEIHEIQTGIMNGWSNIYWVSTSFIEELKQQGMRGNDE